VATFLGEIGYTVFDSYELDKREFEEAMQSFMLDVQPDTDVVFYFAGHGVQIGDENFLMPTDVALETAYDVPFEAVSLTSVLQIMGSRARSMVVILDSCRDNPFAGRTGVVGLAEIEATAQDGFAAERA
ncbi:MAG: caspase family protein, partial [Acidobacteriota bacterium]